MIFVLLLAAIWVSGAILAIVHLRRAPEAVEDDQGFRVVEEPRAKGVALLPSLRTTS